MPELRERAETEAHTEPERQEREQPRRQRGQRRSAARGRPAESNRRRGKARRAEQSGGDGAERGEEGVGTHGEEGDGTKTKSGLGRIPLMAVGVGLVLLVLAGYFVWICAEMGAHALTGAGPLVAIFGAAFAGIIAAGLAFAFGRANRG